MEKAEDQKMNSICAKAEKNSSVFGGIESVGQKEIIVAFEYGHLDFLDKILFVEEIACM